MRRPKMFWGIAFIVGLILGGALSAAPGSVNNPGDYDCDVLIRGGKVFDGSLKPAFRADVAVKDGKIVKVAKRIKKAGAKRIIDARGCCVTPGFIDLHTHAEHGMLFPEGRACLNYLTQGVTTVVVGQCGSSGWPIYETFADQERRWGEGGIGLNAAMLVGHGYVRRLVMGSEDRKPTPEELQKMKSLVKQAMEEGASGLSTGLIYEPSKFAETEEIIELVKVIAPYGGIYHSHIRNEAEHILEAIKEIIRIGTETSAPVHISHLKAVGVPNWGKLKEACRLIEEAQKRGIKISADQYPFRFANTYPYRYLVPANTWRGEAGDYLLKEGDITPLFEPLADARLIALLKKMNADALLSDQYQNYLEKLPREELVRLVSRSMVNLRDLSGPQNAKERLLFLKRWHDAGEAEKIRKEVTDYLYGRTNPENLMIARCVEKGLEGKSLQEAAKIMGKSVVDTAVELHLMGTLVVPLLMCEQDIEYALKKDYVATGSDGVVPFYGIDLYHIRAYTTFLHKIKKYGLERKTAGLAHIIRSQTSLPARIMNWPDKGWIKPGCDADIVVIDLKKLETGASISNPHQYSRGVEFLLVNGQPVIEQGKWTGKLPGKVIRLKNLPKFRSIYSQKLNSYGNLD